MKAAPPLEDVAFEPAKGSPDGTVFECGLCGLRFTHGGKVCTSCALSGGCDLVKCPGCGFQFPRESRVVSLVRRLFRRGGSPERH